MGEDSSCSDFAKILNFYSTVDWLEVNYIDIVNIVSFDILNEVFDKIDTLCRVVVLILRPISLIILDVLLQMSAMLSKLKPCKSILQY